MFWGTDITRMPCSWQQCVSVFTEELPWLQGRDLDLVMGEALCNWVGWPLPGCQLARYRRRRPAPGSAPIAVIIQLVPAAQGNRCFT